MFVLYCEPKYQLKQDVEELGDRYASLTYSCHSSEPGGQLTIHSGSAFGNTIECPHEFHNFWWVAQMSHGLTQSILPNSVEGLLVVNVAAVQTFPLFIVVASCRRVTSWSEVLRPGLKPSWDSGRMFSAWVCILLLRMLKKTFPARLRRLISL